MGADTASDKRPTLNSGLAMRDQAKIASQNDIVLF